MYTAKFNGELKLIKRIIEGNDYLMFRNRVHVVGNGLTANLQNMNKRFAAYCAANKLSGKEYRGTSSAVVTKTSRRNTKVCQVQIPSGRKIIVMISKAVQVGDTGTIKQSCLGHYMFQPSLVQKRKPENAKPDQLEIQASIIRLARSGNYTAKEIMAEIKAEFSQCSDVELMSSMHTAANMLLNQHDDATKADVKRRLRNGRTRR